MIVRVAQSQLVRKGELEETFQRCFRDLKADLQKKLAHNTVDNYMPEDIVRALQILISYSHHLKIITAITTSKYFGEVYNPEVESIVSKLIEEESKVVEKEPQHESNYDADEDKD